MRPGRWHTVDGDPEQEEALEKHLITDRRTSEYHEDVREHDGLAPHQHRVVISRNG